MLFFFQRASAIAYTIGIRNKGTMRDITLKILNKRIIEKEEENEDGFYTEEN